jgi:hypothetical protein
VDWLGGRFWRPWLPIAAGAIGFGIGCVVGWYIGDGTARWVMLGTWVLAVGGTLAVLWAVAPRHWLSSRWRREQCSGPDTWGRGLGKGRQRRYLGERGATSAREVLDETAHSAPVRTLRAPTNGNKTRVEKRRGPERKLYRRYISWTQDQHLCSKHGEKVVEASFRAASGAAGLWLPAQTVGNVTRVAGKLVPEGHTVDMWGWLADDLRGQPPRFTIPVVVEIKNKRRWLYAEAPELWKLLVKAALLVTAHDIAVLPILACSWSGPTASWMAYDVGYFTAQMHVQVFSPEIDETAFDEVVEETGLPIARHDGPVDHMGSWLRTELRKEPPNQPGSGLEWWSVQVERFRLLAPHILEFKVLAEELSTDHKRAAFGAWRNRLDEVAQWELRRGW